MEINRKFSEEKMQMAKKHSQMYSISLVTRKMQINTKLRVYFTAVKIASPGNTNGKGHVGCGKEDAYLLWRCM